MKVVGQQAVAVHICNRHDMFFKQLKEITIVVLFLEQVFAVVGSVVVMVEGASFHVLFFSSLDKPTRFFDGSDLLGFQNLGGLILVSYQ